MSDYTLFGAGVRTTLGGLPTRPSSENKIIVSFIVTLKTVNKSVNTPYFGVSKNTKATEVIPRWPFVLQVVAGAGFEPATFGL